MKKTLLAALAIAALGTMAASAQAVEQPKFFDNWQVGLDGGVSTPTTHHAFWGSMRGAAGLHIGKQITPTFGLGVEGLFNVNTAGWYGRHSTTAFDASYVGVYGTVDLFNLFGGYKCAVRPFTIEALAGSGWGHEYYNIKNGIDQNYFVTKVGLNFNFNVTDHLTIGVKPSIAWNMNRQFKYSPVGYDVNKSQINLLASVSYRFGNGFACVRPYDQAEVDALNAQINELRGDVDASAAAIAALEVTNASLQNELTACQNKKPEVVQVKEVTNELNSVRFVFYRVGSYKITADQMPNVEMIAAYMKNHPNSKVVIKGYASPEGNLDFNIKLANNRAQSVKDMLVNKFKISADRITAEGEGIGKMFEEESWNRVSICTLEEK